MSSVSQAIELAIQHHRAGELAQAQDIYLQILTIAPREPDPWHLLGLTAHQMGDHRLSLEQVRRAIRISPKVAEYFNTLAVALQALGRTGEAVEAFRQSTVLKPDYATGWNNMGLAISELGKTAEAVAALKEALRLDPTYAAAHSNLLLALSHWMDVTPQLLLDEHRCWETWQTKGITPLAQHTNKPDPRRKLRVGYVSPDIRNHAVARFFEPIVRHHNPDNVHVLCYAEVPRPDAVTNRVQAMAHTWRWTLGLSDQQLVDMIVADEVDILIDLAGHTGGSRVRTFAYKPAPIQISYLGYPNTSGLSSIDYKLTDAVIAPQGEARCTTEELARIEGCCSCFQPPLGAGDVQPLPAASSDVVTFGSLHKLSKLNGPVIELWSRLLHKVPNSRILIFRDSLYEAQRQDLYQDFARHGIGPERLVMRRVAPLNSFLGVYNWIDISLDVWPWGGHTTACESMWMGVPMLTLLGNQFAGRMVASVLKAVGLDDWIAHTPDEFLEIGARKAANVLALKELRAGMRDRMLGSELCDGPGFARRLEALYRSMWQRWCLQQALAPKFSVSR